ncbi:MAG TPA: SPOR domain-containing protein, partial [Sulfitobacter sp.]|nr:SPOR domain-containing protein [Sulfitobacter sp.]
MMTTLAGCDAVGNVTGGQKGSAAVASSSTKLVERDVEAPEVFSVSDQGLWDGRPSLGGVWVAHPDVTDPERVIIRNEANGKFVIGALFRRERDLPG